MGYCNGVAHVIEIAKECLRIAKEEQLPAYSIGWFIHNPNVVKRFANAGMEHIEGPEGKIPGVALIRAHGIGDPLRERFLKAGFRLLDGTCGTVAHSQRLIKNNNPEWHIVIAGKIGHSEVDALSQVWDSNKQIIPVKIVETIEDVDALPLYDGETVVFMTQTTFPILQYDKIKSRMEQKYGKYLKMGNRLCPTTSRRLEAIKNLCAKVDAVIVIGGRMSANTTALAHVVKNQGLPVWHIEDETQIPDEIFSFARVGITAGTSTPPEDIEAVYEALKAGAL